MEMLNEPVRLWRLMIVLVFVGLAWHRSDNVLFPARRMG
jgi:hypothetical protein